MIRAANKAAMRYIFDGGLVVDLLGARMIEGEKVVKLTAIEVTILSQLLAHEWTKPKALAARLFGTVIPGADYNNLRVRISWLRRKLDTFDTCVLIEVDRRLGYRIVEEGEE